MRFLAILLFFLGATAQAAVGLTELTGLEGDGPVTVFYPTRAAEEPLKRGPFTVQVAYNGTPERGNGRLIVVSHGSGGSAWTYSDIARALVGAGFVVAMPLHRGDNYADMSEVGPPSWRRRPAEVSRAIDAVGRDARFAPLLQLDKVGMYGMSAGGHTALTLAGGRWSPATLARHCQAHIAEDFASCVGLTASLKGDAFDGVRETVALWVIAWRLSDATWVAYSDPRVQAIVAGVPFAADFDMASLAAPRVPLGFVVADQDKWLMPRFHVGLVRSACKTCELVADIPKGGHGALLSPMPPGLSGRLAELIGDPPGFDRRVLPEVDRKIADFFRKHLL
jgi:predicted dienelactone hydrolase